MKRKIPDLETVSPLGRFDVLVYNAAKNIVNEKSKEYGLGSLNLWDAIKPHANEIVFGALGALEVPTPIKICLGIIQAHLVETARNENSSKNVQGSK